MPTGLKDGKEIPLDEFEGGIKLFILTKEPTQAIDVFHAIVDEIESMLRNNEKVWDYGVDTY